MKTTLYIFTALCILAFMANLAVVFHVFGMQPTPLTFVALVVTFGAAVSCIWTLKQTNN